MYFSRCVRINREFLTITIFRAIAFSKVIFFLEKQIYSQPFTSSSIKLSITRFQSKSWRSNNPMKTRGLNDYISSRSTNNNESCFIQRKLVFWLIFDCVLTIYFEFEMVVVSFEFWFGRFCFKLFMSQFKYISTTYHSVDVEKNNTYQCNDAWIKMIEVESQNVNSTLPEIARYMTRWYFDFSLRTVTFK